MSTAVPLLDKDLACHGRRTFGCLEFGQRGKEKRIRLPLSAVQIEAKVVDRLAHVKVVETFQNPFEDCLEAVYIFPLSGGCVVSSFQLKVGERIIDGKVDERQAARKEYDQAMLEGRRAALLEQDRDDVFTVQVGNLPPGEEVEVILSYSEKLAYFDTGMTEIRLPLVVAPRYMPGVELERLSVGDGTAMDTDQVPDASRISPPRLAAGVNAGIKLGISVVIAGEGEINDLVCSQHATKIGAKKDGLKVSLAREDEILDRDFVLRWRVAEDEVSSSFLVFDNNYGMISVMPPAEREIFTPARDVIFVLDRSGSMDGVKMVSAARACSYLLATLGPRDNFAIQAFDTDFEWLTARNGRKFFTADEAGQDLGQKHLRTITARGGTEIRGALEAAIKVMAGRSDKSARMPVIVVLTDGEVGNEAAVFKSVQKLVDDCRIFTVGIDTAVNDGFLRRLASLGGGTSTFVEPGAQLETALSHVGREIGAPLITDLTVEDINCGLVADSISPVKMSDLFEGRAVNAFFKIAPDKKLDLSALKLRLRGKYVDGAKFETEIAARSTDVRALPQLWAKSFVVDMEDKYRIADHKSQLELKKQIVAVAKEHSILTKFTAFVVVDHAEIVNTSGETRKVVQAVQQPAQWADSDAQAQFPPPAGSIGASMWGAAPASSGWGAAPGSGAWGSAPIQEKGDVLLGGVTGSHPVVPGSPSLGSSANSGWGAPAPLAGRADEWGGGAGPEMPAPPPPPPAMPSAPPPAQQKGGFLRKIFNKPVGDEDMDKVFNENWRLKQQVSMPMVPKSAEGGVFGGAKDMAAPVDEKADIDILKAKFSDFTDALEVCLKDIRDGKMPDGDRLDRARAELIRALAATRHAASMPLLQRYLRAEILQLMAAIAGASVVSQKLKQLGSRHEKELQVVSEEFAEKISDGRESFWQTSV